MMAIEVKLRIISVKSLTYFIAKEIETKGAQEFELMEKEMEKQFSGSTMTTSKEELDVGSYVCAKTNIEASRKSAKKWVRAVVRNVFMSVGTYLYDIYLLDYGVERVVKRAEVREMIASYSGEFCVPYQAINFHLVDVQLRDRLLYNIEAKEFVEELFKKSNYIVSAQIRRQTKANRLGVITLRDGSDLRQHFVERGWADPLTGQTNESTITITDECICDTTVRKPKTSPIFKCLNNSIKKTGEPESHSFSGNNSVDSFSSISSVSSVDLSMDSDKSIVTADEEDFTLNFCTKLNEQKKVEKNINPNNSLIGQNGVNKMNGTAKSRRERLLQMLNLVKLRDQNGITEASNEPKGSSDEPSEAYIHYVSHYESSADQETDWPIQAIDPNAKPYEFQPAGLQPPPEVIQRIYTMKAQKKVAVADDSEMW